MSENRPSDPRRRAVLGAGAGVGAGALALTTFGGIPGIAGQAEAATPPRPHTGGGAPRVTDFGAYISFGPREGAFALARAGRAAAVVVDAGDHPGVVRVAADLCDDIERVTGVRPALRKARNGDVPEAGRELVLIGTLGRSPLIDRLVANGTLDAEGVAGRWETSLQTVVERPLPGVDRAFVIAGSDPRGAVFGAYDVSCGIGVSPWYWWDDVRPEHRDALYVLPGRHTQGTPAVKYRGIFINDENPALGTWAPGHFGPGKAEGYPGGFNADFWAKVFEVMLRLKANYLWPAVWGRAFAEDDPENHARAKEYGIVMGTSHEAPMMRGIEEWNRHAVAAVRDSAGNIVTPGRDPYGGTGEWSFRRNAGAIKAYWRDGIRRMVEQDFEGVVTLGMRGNGDVSLPDGDGIELMQEIIAAQRQILAEETGRDLTDIPQVWTLYKEVQRYWARGLRAPEDVTVVLCDDNWGNIRKHPDPAEPARSGGYGLYYHFDYVGVGRNYKWVDTTSLPNLWDQLRQAAAYGNRTLWMTNVGDLKGNEVPTQFFLDYAWNPDRWDLESIPAWERRYAAQNFGETQAAAIASVLADYARLQSLRKPELLNRRITLDPAKDPATDSSAIVYDDKATPFSLDHHRELERVTEQWQELAERAERIGRRLPHSAQDAWFELVGYEVAATANVYALREAEFTNLRYAEQGRAATNEQAARAETCLDRDFALADRFNSRIAGGKWQGFQTQPHIGYGDVERYGPNAPWQQPELNNVAIPDEIFPAVRRIEIPGPAALGVAVSGSSAWWPHAATAAKLPPLSRYGTAPDPYVEVFNRGGAPFDYRIESSAPWLRVDRPAGRVVKQTRVTVSVDWRRAPRGTTEATLVVHGPDGVSVPVTAVAENPDVRGLRGFVEAGGYIAVDAEHTDRIVGARGIAWQRIDGIGRNAAGLTPVPVTAPSQTPGGSSPRLEYTVSLLTGGPVTLWAYLSPRNPVLPHSGLRYAVSFDDDAPQTVDIIAVSGSDDGVMNTQWARNTSDNASRTATRHTLSPGVHRLTFWMVDPTVVLQRLLIDTGALPDTYLGPQESLRLR
ncbi:glycosyl hydrolase 115 family protein [Streptomyces sp. FIT100]|uniref:glycosyl hydrolase 115 family protein n=1 Tax=Streptomyces sp. FIT100 TaxID=2837956 RepID=UPI0021C59588|nr:glycosyl hydrolase 115 family protein [Streptomyces sp. FIT100]UUN30005.1 glycosyl hydrolase 115 family protein [Streptomyces sp. FIT100]